MTSMTGGEAIVSGLVAHGVNTVFGLPGAQIYGLFDAFQQAQLKVVGARHEQACGYMAFGYARSSGKPGVFSVVPGPGVLNAGAALLTAFGSNEPVLCLTGQVPTPFLGKGRGIVSNADELGLTMAAAYKLWPQTDLMIGIGTRLELPTMSRWPFRPDGLKSIRIDIDPSEMRRYTPDAAVIADAKAGTSELLAAVRRAGYSKTRGRRAAIREASAAALLEIQKVQPQMDYLNILREVLPPNAIVTDELSQVGFTCWYGFPVYEPRTFITSGYQGTLGSGFPTALGAKVAHPDRTVVAITGDGGFMFGVQELATAVQFNIGVVVLVFNNNAYGNVRRDQRERFEGRVVASDLVNPDFVKLAESFGVTAARVTSPQEFRPALEKALANGGPYLIAIEVPKDSETSPWTFIHPAKP